MKNLRNDIKEIGRIVLVFFIVFGVIMLIGWLIKLLFN